MHLDELDPLLSGAVFLGYAVIGLFFLRFWTKSRDRLFAWFAAAFWLLAIERLLLARFAGTDLPAVYLVRLAAFILIIAAIVDKNRRS
jgi:hypothetical protein